MNKRLIPSLIEMLTRLLTIGGLESKNYLQELAGEDIIDQLADSTNQQIR